MRHPTEAYAEITSAERGAWLAQQYGLGKSFDEIAGVVGARSGRDIETWITIFVLCRRQIKEPLTRQTAWDAIFKWTQSGGAILPPSRKISDIYDTIKRENEERERCHREAVRLEADRQERARNLAARERLAQYQAEQRLVTAAKKAKPQPPKRTRAEITEDTEARRKAIGLARRSGRTYRDIGDEYGLSVERIRQIAAKFERIEETRQNKKRYRPNLGRPIDIGGPRDVWMTFHPSPDPRLDIMEPVELEDIAS